MLSALLLAVSAACTDAPDRSLSTNGTTGVSDGEILIGSSCALSGRAAFLGTQALHGTLSYIRQVNEEGGVHGRRIRLVALDDAYDPARCVFNTQQLIGEEKVFALTCYVGTPTTAKIIPLVQEARIPLVGLVTGAAILQEPFRQNIINIRASYFAETAEAVRYFVEDLGIRKLAIFYQHDEYGFDGLTGTQRALNRYGLGPVVESSYIRGSTDVEAAVERIAASEAQATFMIGTYDACAQFIRLARRSRPGMLFYCVSFVGAEELVKLLGAEAEGVIVTQVVPPPWETALPAAEEYGTLLARFFPGDRPNFVSFEGFINAKVLVEILKRTGRELTRERFIETVERMDIYAPGIGAVIRFGRNDHQGMDQVYLTEVKDGRLLPVEDRSGDRIPGGSGHP